MINRILKVIERVSAVGIVATFVFLSTTASKSDDDNNSNAENSQLNTVLKQGSWRMTSFIGKDGDETSDYSGYSFTFNEGGSAIAVKDASITSGTWSAEESGNSTLKLILDFGSSSPLDELAEDWKVVLRSDSKITLDNLSGGDGHTDTMLFEKN